MVSMLYINYKSGAVVIPIASYGMFCGKYYIEDTLTIYKLKADGQWVDLTSFSNPQRDMIFNPLDNYKAQGTANAIAFHSMQPIMSRLGLGAFMQEQNYVNQVTDRQFSHWYKNIQEKTIGHSVQKLEAYEQKYVWKNDRLTPIAAPVKLNFSDAE